MSTVEEKCIPLNEKLKNDKLLQGDKSVDDLIREKIIINQLVSQ